VINKKDIALALVLLVVVLILFVVSLAVGEVHIPLKQIWDILKGNTVENQSFSYIIEARLNRTLMAILGGSSLAVAGLILQVFFRNPLAGPGVLGISSGVTLGVAVVVLGGVSLSTMSSNIAMITSGLLGAFFILSLLMIISKYIINSVTLLIVGLMLSYFTSAFVNALYHWADLEQTRQFVVWGLGSFADVNTEVIKMLSFMIIIIDLSLIFLVKPLNALVLGESYAKSMGINIKVTKILIIIITSLLTALITVYCGPIAFIGIAVPQIVRQFSKSKSHQVTLPLALLTGALFAVLADVLIRLSGSQLPLNTITSLIGAPIIIWTILKMNKVR